MNPDQHNHHRVLGIAPCVQGIGFVVFDGPKLPIDWGVKWARGDKNEKGVASMASLIQRYQPDLVVFEDHRGEGSRRAKRIEDLLDAIASLVARRGIPSVRYSRNRVRRHFAAEGAATKYQIATVIAAAFPELAPRLPAVRKIWLPEHANMSLFDAVAFVLTHFAEPAEASVAA